MKVRGKDVAIRAGVSEATVCHILVDSRTGRAYSQETRERVIRAAAELQYRPNPNGRGLRKNRSFLIGVSFFGGNTLYLAEFLQGVQSALDHARCTPVTYCHESAADEARCFKAFRDCNVDGLIVNSAYYKESPPADSQTALVLSKPVVEVFGHKISNVPTITVNLAEDGRMAVQHLLQLGHRSIIYLTHDRYDHSRGLVNEPHFDAWSLYQGYQQGMVDAGLAPIVLTHPLTGEIDVENEFINGGRELFQNILEHPAKPTAVICYNDLEAYGLVRAARRANVNIPQRLSVIGYADLMVSRLTEPALTTFKAPVHEVGRKAAEAVIQLIDTKPVESASLPSTMICRESTAPPQ